MSNSLYRNSLLVLLVVGWQSLAGATGTASWLWERSTGALVRGAPVLAGRQVIAGSFSGKVMALDRGSGKPAWQFDAGNAVATSPLVAGSRVYVSAADNRIYALDLRNGRQVWRFELGSPGLYPLLSRGDTLLAATRERIFALDAATSRQKWAVQVAKELSSPPSAAGDMVFLASHGAEVAALRLGDGSVVWRHVDARFQVESLAAGNGMVFAASADGRVRALDQQRGKPRWEFQGHKALRGTIAATNTLVLVALGSELVALDQISGIVVWKQVLAAPVAVTPVLHGSHVYVLDRDGLLSVRRLADGHELAQFATGRPLTSPPAVSADRLYFGTRDGRILALGGII